MLNISLISKDKVKVSHHFSSCLFELVTTMMSEMAMYGDGKLRATFCFITSKVLAAE